MSQIIHCQVMLFRLILPHTCVSVFPGGLGSVRWWLWWVVPPGVRGRVVRNGREWGLHLRGLLPQGRRGRRRDDHGGSAGGEHRGAFDVNVQQQHAEPALILRRGLVVPRILHFSPEPSNFTSAAAARASAGQLALKTAVGLTLNTVPHASITQNPVSRLEFEPVRQYDAEGKKNT